MKAKPQKIRNRAIKKMGYKRPLHRHISLHPATVFFLLCVGVFLVASTFQAVAASTSISLKIHAPIPPAPAVISSPPDQSRFDKPDQTVSGTCPADSYIKLYNNGVFSGAAPCTDGRFQLMITLVEGSNVLQAKVFNTTDDEGPTSPNVTVYYEPVIITPPSGIPSRVPTAKGEPFRIVSDYRHRVYKSNQEVSLNIGLLGGLAPYAVAVDWGDGQISSYSRSNTSMYKATHTYAQNPRLYTYIVKIAASDINGKSAYLQLIAVVDGTVVAAAPTAPAPPTKKSFAWLSYLWPAYLMFVMMVISFWLGEREELRILTKARRVPLGR